MLPRSMGLRAAWKLGVVVAAWIGANCIALAWIDIYDSRLLEDEYDIPARVIRSFEWRTMQIPVCKASGTATLWYRYRPPPWLAGARSVPLVVFLHGAGESGTDNVCQLRHLPSHLCNQPLRDSCPCALLAPQCPQPGGWSQRLDAETDCLDGVLRIIDVALADPRIDPNRIYLTGLSMGGFGTWELALRAPERFAAVVPICGGGDETRAARLVNVALWAVHGADDEVVPVTKSRCMIAAIREAGGRPRYLELPGVGHNCWDAVYQPDSKILAWMFRQRVELCPYSTTGSGGNKPVTTEPPGW